MENPNYVNKKYKYVYDKNVKSPFLNKLRRSHMPSERWNSKLDQFANNEIYKVLKNAQKNQYGITKKFQLLKQYIEGKFLAFVYKDRARPNSLLDYVETFVDVNVDVGVDQTDAPFSVVVSTQHLDKDKWAITDEAFCEYRLSGPNPTKIKLCTEDDLTNNGLQDDGEVCELLKARRLFIVDYSSFADLPPSKTVLSDAEKHVYGTVALFKLEEDELELDVSKRKQKLEPVCIKVTSKKNDQIVNSKIFRPNDDKGWKMAKCIFQSNDGVHHEAFAHLAGTHLVSEAFMVATYRRLPKGHPLYVLLDKHFEGTAFINDTAVTDLVRDGGAVDLLVSPAIGPVRKLVADFVAEKLSKDLTFPARMKAREMDEIQLPKLDFPYRDDGMLLWNAILKWSNDYLQVYYKDHNEVMQDNCIKNWLKELESDKGGRVKWLESHKFDGSNARDQLGILVASIIFIGSVEHAAVNFPQRHIMQFTGAFPLAMYAGDVVVFDEFLTKEDYLSLYPPMKEARVQAQVAQLLGGIHYTRLGYYDSKRDETYFVTNIDEKYKDPEHGSNVKKALEGFHDELKKATEEIHKRNENRKFPYVEMLPDGIPQSINI